MSEFNASLLREKFVIHDAMPQDLSDREPVIALSNRLALPLVSDDGAHAETFVVRAQNMHTCARLAAMIAKEFQDSGPLLDRKKPFDWRAAWLLVTKGYEKKWNPHRWAAIYNKGRIVFETGTDDGGARHPFLDVIEQCDARNKGDYEKAMDVARDAFQQAGRLVKIEHDSNVALIMNVTPEEGKCGIIVRSPMRTTTFNMTAKKKAGRAVHPSQCLTAAAAFLEGIQLAFFVGLTRQRIHYEIVAPASEEGQKCEDASHKLARLNGAVAQFENLLDVKYRPDRPNFATIVDEAEEHARKMLAEEISLKVKMGGEEAGKWVV